MSAVTVHFLLVYSHKDQKLVSQEEFRDSSKATKAYAAAERAHMGSEDYEIVLIGSDSIQTIMKTHGHYFSGEKSSFPLELTFSY